MDLVYPQIAYNNLDYDLEASRFLCCYDARIGTIVSLSPNRRANAGSLLREQVSDVGCATQITTEYLAGCLGNVSPLAM
jgi:hypothetical protein